MKDTKIGSIFLYQLASWMPLEALVWLFGFEEAFKEGRGIQGGKSHSRMEKAFMEGKAILGENIWLGQTKHSGREFFKTFLNGKSYIFLIISGPWGGQKYPMFQNWSTNMTRPKNKCEF